MSDKVKKLGGMFSYYVEDDSPKRDIEKVNGKPGMWCEKPWFAMDDKEKIAYLAKHHPELSKEEIEKIIHPKKVKLR